MEILFSAWTTAVWWAAVIFFVGLILGVTSLILAGVVAVFAETIDNWAEKHDKNTRSN